MKFVDAGRATGFAHIGENLIEFSLKGLLHIAARLRLQLATLILRNDQFALSVCRLNQLILFSGQLARRHYIGDADRETPIAAQTAKSGWSVEWSSCKAREQVRKPTCAELGQSGHAICRNMSSVVAHQHVENVLFAATSKRFLIQYTCIEFLRYSPTNLLTVILCAYRKAARSGEIPRSHPYDIDKVARGSPFPYTRVPLLQ